MIVTALRWLRRLAHSPLIVLTLLLALVLGGPAAIYLVWHALKDGELNAQERATVSGLMARSESWLVAGLRLVGVRVAGGQPAANSSAKGPLDAKPGG